MNLIILCLFIFGYIYQLKAKVVFNIRIHSYKNVDNVKHDGAKCDDFFFVGDSCDPIFTICVTSVQSCDVLSKKIDFWKNKKTLFTVLNTNVVLDKMPASVSVRVKVDDYDSDDSHDHIGVFSSSFITKDLRKIYQSKMKVTPAYLKISMSASVIMRCAINFYGNQCDRFCLSDQKTYKCDVSTGDKICTKVCGKGRSHYDKSRDQCLCECNIGWEGDLCDVFRTNNCSSLNCNLTCNFTNLYRKCQCTSNSIFKRECQELLTLTSGPMSTSTKSVSVFPSSASIQTVKPSTTEIQPEIIHTKTIEHIKITTITTNIIKTMKSTSRMMRTSNRFQPRTTEQTTKFLTPIKSLSTMMISRNHFPFSSPAIRTADQLIQKEKNTILFGNSAMLSQTPVMIIIICLLVLLCVCVITMSILITTWQKKQAKKFPESTFTLRPLPPIIYNPPLVAKDTYKCQTRVDSRPDNEYESCSAPFSHSENDSKNLIQTNYETSNYDPYEEPIITNMDSLTCETECHDSDDNDLYETPIKF